MKETERDKRIKEQLELLKRRVSRLSTEIEECVPEMIIRAELKLIDEAMSKLKEEFNYEV